MAKGTHCLPNTSCEPDSLQPSPYTPTLRSRDLLTGESLSPPCYIRKIRHRDVGVLLRVTEPGQELCSSVLQNRILLSRGKMVRGEAIGTSWGEEPQRTKAVAHSLTSSSPSPRQRPGHSGRASCCQAPAAPCSSLPAPRPIPRPCWPQET